MNPPNKLKLIIFDMDGTITVPTLDFKEIKAAVGAPPELYTLEYLRSLQGEERQNKFAILHEYEDDAARNAIIRDGAVELLHDLDKQGYLLALLTRNSDRSVEIICKTHELHFHHRFTRDNAPAKPDPEPIRSLLNDYELKPSEAVMIGDFWIDVKTGKAAGCRTILFRTPGLENKNEIIPDAEVSTFRQLEELLLQWNG
jgi:HAD superfamily hydrolase (TIGR01509 family)